MAVDKYLFFDGTNYISPCDCNISIYDYTNSPQIIDPENCILKFYDGANWCPLVCPCECPAGYTFSYVTNNCIKAESAEFTGTTTTIAQGHQNRLYTGNGLRLYNDLSAYTLPLLGNVIIDPFQLIDNNGTGVIAPLAIPAVQNKLWGDDSLCVQSQIEGRLNVVGIWPPLYPKGSELPFEYCITLSAPKQYLFGMSGDDMTLSIDSGSGFVDQVKLRNSGPTTNYEYNWWVFPITLAAGTHVVKFSGQDLWVSTGAIGFEIYDMGDTTVGPNAPYTAPYDKFVDFLTTPSTVSPSACGNTEADILPFLEFTSDSLVGFNIPAFGQTGTWSCPDGSAVDECNGTPQCLDAIPCTGNLQPPLISANTEINIWFDNSGSMNSSLAGLNDMRNNFLQPCLLPIYATNALYNERVKVFNMYSNGVTPSWNYNERFIRCLGEGRNFQRTADTNVVQVLNLTFADESNVYGYGGPQQFDNLNRSPQYDLDVAFTRNQQATLGYDVRGTQFRINTGPNSFPGYRELSRSTFINNGVYTPPNNLADFYEIKYNVNLDTIANQGGEYYRNVVVAALNALGLNIPLCP